MPIGGLDMSIPDMDIHYSKPGPTTVPVPDADLDFIPNARQDIPRLVEEVRRLRELLSESRPPIRRSGAPWLHTAPSWPDRSPYVRRGYFTFRNQLSDQCPIATAVAPTRC
jgi:hypothetical protein